ncbi:MAG: segregation/condensation protein A, partial [Anaerolineae bacterium]|nr:segregation/condensation protein A [Anaerolineae bacterium]
DVYKRQVVPFTLTIEDQIQHIRRAAHEHGRITFQGLLRHVRHRMEIIVTLLAVLELIKQRQVIVTQPQAFGEIYIEPASVAVPDQPEEMTDKDLK